MREHFPRHPHMYFGVSGTTLLLEAFQQQPRSTVVLPAFICPNISAAAVTAGKRVIHIDARRNTQLPDPAQMETCLAGLDESDTALLIDHSFGYPFANLPELRRRFPKLLIVEDHARALGMKVGGSAPGASADLILFSMYKTIPGSSSGAVLLSTTPLRIEEGPRLAPTVRERVATIPPLKYAYHLMQRFRSSELRSRVRDKEARFPQWTPQHGLPSELCCTRFFAELTKIETRGSERRAIAEELTASLTKSGIDCIQAAEGHQTAGNFVSVRLGKPHTRDLILTRLCKKGLFVGRTWDIIPIHFRAFDNTFPFGYANSQHLAEQMIHIRLALFSNAAQRRRLVQELREVTRNTALLPEKASAASFS
jgi:dTDP-4-amino-4,6-dideoxygalactose transaminase